MNRVRSPRLTFAAVSLLLLSGCSGASEPSPAPSLACPAPVAVQSADGLSASVSFPPPSVSGGASPVAPSCSPASGSTFPVGTTTVNCTAQAASCSFTVRVTAPPQVAATRFIAFGDSITEGKTGDCIRTQAAAGNWLEEQRLLPQVQRGSDYPRALQALMLDRYGAQAPSVVNLGRGGELAGTSETRQRLVTSIAVHGAEVVLLQEGINDLHLEPSPRGVEDTVIAIRRLVQEAKGRGTRVFLATLLPQRPGSCRSFSVPGMIEAANEGIRALAAAEGVVLVDLYPVIAADLATLLGQDGLHPTVAGYSRIAETFFEAIRQQLEVQRPTQG